MGQRYRQARVGYQGERATNRPPKAADEVEWNDWLLAMLTLQKLYTEHGHVNIGKQTLSLISGALIGSATYTRASIMTACEVLRKDWTSDTCKWSLDTILLHGKCRILLKPIVENPRFKRRLPSFTSPPPTMHPTVSGQITAVTQPTPYAGRSCR